MQLEDFFEQISSPLLSDTKFKYVGDFVQNSSTSNKSLKAFFRGGEFITVGKLKQPIDNQVMKVEVEGVIEFAETHSYASSRL